jgi:hypothetical protein
MYVGEWRHPPPDHVLERWFVELASGGTSGAPEIEVLRSVLLSGPSTRQKSLVRSPKSDQHPNLMHMTP